MCFIKNEQAVWGIWYEAKNTVAFFRAEVSIVIMVDCFDTDVQRTKDVGHVATAPLLDLRPNIFSAYMGSPKIPVMHQKNLADKRKKRILCDDDCAQRTEP